MSFILFICFAIKETGVSGQEGKGHRLHLSECFERNCKWCSGAGGGKETAAWLGEEQTQVGTPSGPLQLQTCCREGRQCPRDLLRLSLGDRFEKLNGEEHILRPATPPCRQHDRTPTSASSSAPIWLVSQHPSDLDGASEKAHPNDADTCLL